MKAKDAQKISKAAVTKAIKELVPKIIVKIEEAIKEQAEKGYETVTFKFTIWMREDITLQTVASELENRGFVTRVTKDSFWISWKATDPRVNGGRS